MEDFLKENFGKIAAWLPVVLIVIAAIALVAIWRLWRWHGKKWVRVFGLTTAAWFCCSSVAGLIIAYGPMSPLVTNAQRLQVAIGEPLPDISFRMVQDGSIHRLSEFKGRVVLINLWATWCPPCPGELSTLNRLQAAYRGSGLTIVTLADEPRAKLFSVVQGRSPECINGSVDSFDWLTIETFRPFTLIIDRQGLLRDYIFGVQEYSTFEKKVQKFL